MDLDDRAHRASDSLRQQVEPSLDLSAARSSMAAGSAAHRSRRRLVGIGGGVVALVAVIAIVAAVAGTGGSGDGKVATDDGKRSNDTNGDSASASAILGAMPRGPLDGKESYKLPVLAKPQSGLYDGDTVTIYGTSYEPNDSLGIVQCSAEAADADGGAAGVGACQLATTPSGRRPRLTADERQQIDDYVASLESGARWDDPAEPPPEPPTPANGEYTPEYDRMYGDYDRIMQIWTNAGGEYPDSYGAVTYADADADGSVVATFVVHRFITTPEGGKIDCASGPERCLIGMGAISDYDRSGGSFIGFAGAPDFPEPSLIVDPAGDPAGTFTPGQAVTAHLVGSMPNRQVRAKQCVADQCQNLVDGRADTDGVADLAVTFQPSIVDSVTGAQIACEDRCVLRVTGIGTEGASSAPQPADIDLRFTSADPSVPLTSAPSTAPTAVPSTEIPATTLPDSDPSPTTQLPLCDGQSEQPCQSVPATGPPGQDTAPAGACNDTPVQGPSATCVPATADPP